MSESKIINKGNLSSEQSEVLNAINIPTTVNVEIEEVSTVEKDVIDMNGAFNLKRKMYENVLAPQLEKNEKLKREHKTTLVNNLLELLKLQFKFTYVFVMFMIACIVFSNCLNVSDKIVINLIKFIEFYITSIVVELISILFFIVKSVFDKSIVDLISGFDKNNKEQEK